MKEAVEFLRKRGLLFKELEKLDLKAFGIRKRVELYQGVDLSNRYHLLLFVKRKSRFLQKDAVSLLELIESLEQRMGHSFAKKSLFLQAPLCSKAKALLQERGVHVAPL